MHEVAEILKSVIDKMTCGIYFNLVNILRAENVNLTQEYLHLCIDNLEIQWNLPVVSCDTLTSRSKPSTNGQHSYSWWSFGIFDESHRYRTKSIPGW